MADFIPESPADFKSEPVADMLRNPHARVHATTGEVPADRLERERQVLCPIPPPYGGQLPHRTAEAPSPARPPVAGLQHPLALYDALFAAPGMPGAAP